MIPTTVPVAPFMTFAGESRTGRTMEVSGVEVQVKLSGHDTDGRFSLVEATIPPGGGPPLHFHTREDEFFYVVEGVVTFTLDDQEIEAGPGVSLFGPRLVPHAFRNNTRTTARMLVLATPAGIEDFFAEVHDTVQLSGFDPETMDAIARKFGMALFT